MIGEDDDVAAFDEVAKVLDSQVNGQKFPAKSAVARLRGLQFLREKCERLFTIRHLLVENRADGCLGSVNH